MFAQDEVWSSMDIGCEGREPVAEDKWTPAKDLLRLSSAPLR
jgi:hypothetical protein